MSTQRRPAPRSLSRATRGLAENTIVIFMTDNGPASGRFNAGLRGLKGDDRRGRYPRPVLYSVAGPLLPAGHVVEPAGRPHRRLFPTLRGRGLPQDSLHRNLKLDGRSLLPLLRGRNSDVEWPARTLFFQRHRGDTPQPELGRAFAVRTQKYKLVGPEPIPKPGQDKLELPKLELYDLENDLREEHNIAAVSAPARGRILHDRVPGLVPERLLASRVRSGPIEIARASRGPDRADSPGPGAAHGRVGGPNDFGGTGSSRPRCRCLTGTFHGPLCARHLDAFHRGTSLASRRSSVPSEARAQRNRMLLPADVKIRGPQGPAARRPGWGPTGNRNSAAVSSLDVQPDRCVANVSSRVVIALQKRAPPGRILAMLPSPSSTIRGPDS